MCILIHTVAKLDHALTPYFIIAAVWNDMEHRECIGGGEKTKQQLSNWVGLSRGGEAVIKATIISKWELNKKGRKSIKKEEEKERERLAKKRKEKKRNTEVIKIIFIQR